MNSLLSRTLPQSLPTFSSASNLATSFLNFFTDKVTKLSASFPSVPLILPHCPPPVPPPNLFQFLPATTAEVRKIILTSSSTTCCLDSIPTSLLKSCIDVLVTPITILVNLSLSEGSFHLISKPPLLDLFLRNILCLMKICQAIVPFLT